MENVKITELQVCSYEVIIMGMFDYVIVECPNCSGRVEFQSKVGDCILTEYDEYTMPIEIAQDLNNEEMRCAHCKRYVKLNVQLFMNAKVELI